MTAVADHLRGGQPVRRAWRAPLGAHLAALGIVLVAVTGFAGTGASFSADEGAAITQARSLARGDGWIVPHPVPEADPEGVNYPIELSAEGPRGVAPFAKHPLYALVLAGADRVGGVGAMVALSLLGTLGAAATAAALAARMGGPGLARPALWGAGLGTPLLLDGNLVIAHTLGAALAGALVLVAVAAVERRRPAPALAVAVGLLAALAVLLRTEALLLAVALALAAGAVALRRRGGQRWAAALVGGVAVAGAGLAMVAEKLWASAIVGGTAIGVGGPSGTTGFVYGRVRSFTLTWLRPSYEGGTGDVVLVVMATAVALAVLAARRHPGDGGPVVILTVVAAAMSVLALVVAPNTVVPGLLIASPLVLAGMVALRRAYLVDRAGTGVTLALGTSFGFALAVLATQYSTGGSFEWGGRYFAIGLPVFVPVALLALRQVGEGLAPATRKVAAAGLVVCSASLAVMAVGALEETKRFTGEMMVAIDRTAGTIGDPRPVILTTERAVPRTAWATYDRQRWLLELSDDLAPAVDRLRAAGIDRIALVSSRGRERLLRQLGPGVGVVARDAWAERVGWQVLVLRLK